MWLFGLGYPNKNVQGDALFSRIGLIFGCGAARCHLKASDSQFTVCWLANTFCASNAMCVSFCASKRLEAIEELWGYLERLRSEQFGPARTVVELKRQLNTVWNGIDQVKVNKFVASFEAKLKRVRKQ